MPEKGRLNRKKTTAPIRNGRQLVEMAGIEPASGRFGPRTSTSVVGRASRPGPYDRQKGVPTQPLVLRTGRGPPVRHPDFVAPAPSRSGSGMGGRGLASQEAIALTRATLRSDGQSGYICAVGTYRCAPVLRGDAPRLAVRSISPPVEACHPHDVKVPFRHFDYSTESVRKVLKFFRCRKRNSLGEGRIPGDESEPQGSALFPKGGWGRIPWGVFQTPRGTSIPKIRH